MQPKSPQFVYLENMELEHYDFCRSVLFLDNHITLNSFSFFYKLCNLKNAAFKM